VLLEYQRATVYTKNKSISANVSGKLRSKDNKETS
jgi:hypothetical protein